MREVEINDHKKYIFFNIVIKNTHLGITICLGVEATLGCEGASNKYKYTHIIAKITDKVIEFSRLYDI